MNLIPLASIIVLPERQRGPDSPGMAPEKIADLADSIEARGLLQPLIIEQNGRPILRAGERRSKAIALLYAQGQAIKHGKMEIPLGMVPVVEFDELAPVEAFLIELDENEKREPLTLQERAAAYAHVHALLAPKAATPKEAVRETLAAINRTAPSAVPTGGGQLHAAHQLIVIGQNLHDPDVAKAKTEREAVKILSRKFRKSEDAARPQASDPHLFNGDVYDILPGLPEAHFDCVLTDPPYGIEIRQFSSQDSSEQEYDDSYEEWKRLMPFVFDQWKRVLKPDAHGYAFCAFERFGEMAAIAQAAGFETYPKPLIWDRSPDGRLTTPEKWPRRCYECILYFRRGNAPLWEVRGDVLRYPADRDSINYHGAKKPIELAIDLLERSTRPGDRVLDCFGGSGFVLRAGKRVEREIWIIEKDPAYFGLMQTLVEGDISSSSAPLFTS